MRYEESLVSANDHTRLFVRTYTPCDGSDRSIVLLHGATEHGGRLEPLARYFCHAGWRVIVPDHRGHGRSSGRPTHLRRFTDYLFDVEAICRMQGVHPARSAMVGISMGGLVAIRHAQRFPGRFAAVGLISPLLGLGFEVPPALINAGRLFSKIWPRARFRSILDPADVSKFPASLEGEGADPLIHRSVTAGWYFSTRKALRQAWTQGHSIQCPFYVMQAEIDRVVDVESSYRWAAMMGLVPDSYRLLRGQYHDLLAEPSWRSDAAILADWMDEQVPQQLRSYRLQAA
ncbi:alpha/beta fold hydrolase [Stratiformator vulcanicus]|uniref:Phospholipase YtpA n=1 Tax=Stratiformator vulcanicus TaxID=2527980 RepID=A0A517QVX2_9PLAN|nr:alpha/beta fold hydrolase [Stratiformator vulcanicus]QDT35809.1 Phospholipase YtpA [Stratiformator vulcanicus]